MDFQAVKDQEQGMNGFEQSSHEGDANLDEDRCQPALLAHFKDLAMDETVEQNEPICSKPLEASPSSKGETSVSKNSFLGLKRRYNESTLQMELQDSNFNFEIQTNGKPTTDKKLKRLLNNRISAKRSRQKKKVEYDKISDELLKLQSQSQHLKDNINNVIMMLYKQIEDNRQMHSQIQERQVEHTLFLRKLLDHEQEESMSSQDGSQGQSIKNYSAKGPSDKIAMQQIVREHLLQLIGPNGQHPTSAHSLTSPDAKLASRKKLKTDAFPKSKTTSPQTLLHEQTYKNLDKNQLLSKMTGTNEVKLNASSLIDVRLAERRESGAEKRNGMGGQGGPADADLDFVSKFLISK